MIVKSHDIAGIDDANAPDWRLLAAQRLTRLTDSEHACGELQQQVERLRQEQHQLLADLHGHKQALASCHEELSRLRPIGKSWAATAWHVVEWVRRPTRWLKWLAGIRALRRLMGLVLRLAPGLRARLMTKLGLT
ncbi:MAG TPA: hypothetical protein VME63_04800 [Dyella sp.]|uniref:hypothetical protein n=1 Tax=Dyella sp. TaxID=1869338 RepID=UPI002CB8C19A|nr:hypothetical protein [Dyella sp.]HTV84698.1 hypothetical protein [Dyella sp.]